MLDLIINRQQTSTKTNRGYFSPRDLNEDCRWGEGRGRGEREGGGQGRGVELWNVGEGSVTLEEKIC